MKVVPYVAVGEVAFGSAEIGVTSVLGRATRRSTTKSGRLQLDYAHLIVRLSSDEVVEVGADCPTITLGNAIVPFPHLVQFLRHHDAGVFETLGITVSPAFGITVDPHFPAWINAFAKSELESWMKYAA